MAVKTFAFDNSSTSEKIVDDIHKVVKDGISSNMFSVVNHGCFGAVITDYPKEDDYYIIKFTSNPYIIQKDVIIDGVIIEMSKKVANACCLNSLR